MNDSSLVRIDNLSKRFGEKNILENVNLDVYEGEILGLIGKSGAGKSTLLKCLAGFSEPNEGRILIKRRIKEDSLLPTTYRKREFFNLVGFSAQEPSFYPQLTIKENLDYFASLYSLDKQSIEKNIANVIRLIGLNEERHNLAGELSQGMQKLLDISCALVHKPRILVLDEPTSNLDPIFRKELLKLIRNLNDDGMTIIITSHLLDELEPICHRIAVMHEKKVIAVAQPHQLKSLISEDHNTLHDLLEALENLKAKQTM